MKVLDTRLDAWRRGAEAPNETVRTMLEKAIEKSEGGYEEFGRRLADVLHKWLLERAKGLLEGLPERNHLRLGATAVTAVTYVTHVEAQHSRMALRSTTPRQNDRMLQEIGRRKRMLGAGY